MKYLIVILLYAFASVLMGQYDDFDSFGGSGEWTNIGGQTNTGSHSSALCFNISGNYLNNQYYTYESPVYDFTDCDSVLIEWEQSSLLRIGDYLYVCYYSDAWYCYDMSNLIGIYSSYVSNGVTMFSIDLTTYGIGSRNGFYSHVEYFDISCIQQPLPLKLVDFNCVNSTVYFYVQDISNVDYFDLEYSINNEYYDLYHRFELNGELYSTAYNHEGYYRLVEVNINGNRTELETIFCAKNTHTEIKYYSILGQEIDHPKGLHIKAITINGVTTYEKGYTP